jgi:hypothetical protein
MVCRKRAEGGDDHGYPSRWAPKMIRPALVKPLKTSTKTT